MDELRTPQQVENALEGLYDAQWKTGQALTPYQQGILDALEWVIKKQGALAT